MAKAPQTKRGRPLLDAEMRRDYRIVRLGLTAEESARWEAAALAAGKDLPGWAHKILDAAAPAAQKAAS